MQSKIVLEFGEDTSTEIQCQKSDIFYKRLKPSQKFHHLEWFRIHSYIINYDQVLFISNGARPRNVEKLFDRHQQGKLGAFHNLCFLADKSAIETFRPPDEKVNSQQCIDLIQERSPETYLMEIELALVGTELKNIFKSLKMSTCGACSRYALEMDRNGVKWCEDNKEEVIQNIAKNAKRLGHKGGRLMDYGIPKILDIAIRRAKKQSTLMDDATLLAAKTFMSVKNKVEEK